MHVVVVGGGISGLAAAYEASRRGARVTVLEGSARLGGKLAVSEVGGRQVDEGAESLLTRAPEGLDLVRDVGLGDELVRPATAAAGVWSRGALRPLPTRTLLGLPTDLAALARSELLSARGLNRVPLDLVLPGRPLAEDVSVGAYVAGRLGREVVDRLVDPLLGGVYAGRADQLSLHMTLPQLVPHLVTRRSLILAARAALPAAAGPAPFATLPGGLGRLPQAVATASGAEVRLRTTVRELRRTPTGWRLTTGSAAAPEELEADAVVLAVPAAPAARLLAGLVPTAAAELAGLDYASVALITLVLDRPVGGTGSGFLVPAVEGRTTKAVTFTSRKWGHLAGDDRFVLRGSVGRHGDTADLQRTDVELVAAVTRDLVDIVGPLPRVLDTRVSRWGGSLPQYGVGHRDLVRRVRSAVARHPGLAVAGAAYDGVGIPACIRSGREAAAQALAHNGGHDRDPG